MMKPDDISLLQELENDKGLSFHPIRAQGPGGQHVNKVSSAVELRYDLNKSELSEELKVKLATLPDKRVSRDGVIIIKAQTARSQLANKRDALSRLISLIQRANHVQKKRKPTRPSRASKRKRLEAKSHLSKKKSLRKKVIDS